MIRAVASSIPHQPTVVGCGFIALDVLVDADVQVQYSGVGGTVGNVMSIMAYLGWRSVPMARLGADAAGMRVLQEMTALGVDTRHVSLDSHIHTPIVYQRNEGNSAGAHSFSFRCPHCGQARRFDSNSLVGLQSSISTPLAQRGDVYFFDRLTDDSVRLAEQAKVDGALTVFEPSAVGDDVALFQRALQASKVVKYSAERLGEAVMPSLDTGFVEIQTHGAAGLRFRMHSLDPAWVPLPAIFASDVVDTAGAGDWCTAGFLHIMSRFARGGMLCDLGYNEVYSALRAGQLVAALNCRHTGARGLMRHIDSLRLRDALQVLAQRPATLAGDVTDSLFDLTAQLPARASTVLCNAAPRSGAVHLCCDSFASPSCGGLALLH